MLREFREFREPDDFREQALLESSPCTRAAADLVVLCSFRENRGLSLAEFEVALANLECFDPGFERGWWNSKLACRA